MKILAIIIGLSFNVWSWFIPEAPLTQADAMALSGMFMVWLAILSN